MYLHVIIKTKGPNMNLSPRTRILLFIMGVFWITLDQETYSLVADLGTELITNIINQFWAEILTTILLRYA
ncbi:hypothetical protein FOF66_06170 [Lactobacillus gasseri]|nr:hypothetical protein FOF66_06170 [Lactobacillus gasseri]